MQEESRREKESGRANEAEKDIRSQEGEEAKTTQFGMENGEIVQVPAVVSGNANYALGKADAGSAAERRS